MGNLVTNVSNSRAFVPLSSFFLAVSAGLTDVSHLEHGCIKGADLVIRGCSC